MNETKENKKFIQRVIILLDSPVVLQEIQQQLRNVCKLIQGLSSESLQPDPRIPGIHVSSRFIEKL